MNRAINAEELCGLANMKSLRAFTSSSQLTLTETTKDITPHCTADGAITIKQYNPFDDEWNWMWFAVTYHECLHWHVLNRYMFDVCKMLNDEYDGKQFPLLVANAPMDNLTDRSVEDEYYGIWCELEEFRGKYFMKKMDYFKVKDDEDTLRLAMLGLIYLDYQHRQKWSQACSKFTPSASPIIIEIAEHLEKTVDYFKRVEELHAIRKGDRQVKCNKLFELTKDILDAFNQPNSPVKDLDQKQGGKGKPQPQDGQGTPQDGQGTPQDGQGDSKPCPDCKGTGKKDGGFSDTIKKIFGKNVKEQPCPSCGGDGKDKGKSDKPSDKQGQAGGNDEKMAQAGVKESSDKNKSGGGGWGGLDIKNRPDIQLTQDEITYTNIGSIPDVQANHDKLVYSSDNSAFFYHTDERIRTTKDFNNSSNTEKYLKALDTVRANTNLSRDIQQHLLARKQAGYSYGHTTGRLHSKSIWKATVRSKRSGAVPMFKQRDSSRIQLDTVVSLLVDGSGSMQNPRASSDNSMTGVSFGGYSCGRYFTALASAYSMAEVLNSLRVDFEIVRFSRQYETLYHTFYKQFNERASMSQLRTAMGKSMMADCNKNSDGETIQLAYSRILKQKQQNKIIIVFSDGKPCDFHDGSRNRGGSGRWSGGSLLKKTVENIEKQERVFIGAIGILTSNVEDYYTNYSIVQDLKDLDRALLTMLKNNILR